MAPRQCGIDALRGLALLLIVEQHLGVWLIDPVARALASRTTIAINATGAFGAPLFFCLAGVGAALFVTRQRPAARPGELSKMPAGSLLSREDGTSLRRGLALLVFGLLLNLVTPSWFSWGSFFALHLLGVGVLLSPVLRRIPSGGVLVLAGLLVLAAPLCQIWLGTPEHLSNDRMRDMSLPGSPLRQALVEGQYPVFPWLAIFLTGFVAGRHLQAGRQGPIVLLGTASALLGGAGAYWHYSMPPGEASVLARASALSWFPASATMCLLVLAGALYALALGVAIDRRWPLSSRNALVTSGRVSLTVFLVHIPLFRELVPAVGLGRSLQAGPAGLVTASVLVLIMVLSRRWQRADFRFGAEWLLRRVAG